MLREITFGEFAGLCRSRRIDEACLVDRFPNIIERGGKVPDSTASFFHRGFEKRYSAVVIPYRPLIEFYSNELAYDAMKRGEARRCPCGCAGMVAPGRKYATHACRKRAPIVKSSIPHA